MGAARLCRRRAGDRDHRGDRLSRSHSGLSRRLCRRRRVLRHLRLPDHASDRQPVADRRASRPIDFYARRMLRILPPLLLVTVVTLTIATLFPLLPQEGRELAKSAAATAAMISNYYFSTAATISRRRPRSTRCCTPGRSGSRSSTTCWRRPFMGAMVALAARRNWDATRALLIGGTIAIAGLPHHAGDFERPRSPPRVLLDHDAGLAVRRRRHAGDCRSPGTPAQARLRPAFGVLGLLAIAASVLLYHEHMRYPGIAAGLLPTHRHANAAGIRPRQRARAAGAAVGEPSRRSRSAFCPTAGISGTGR